MADRIVSHFNDPNVSWEQKHEKYNELSEKYDTILAEVAFTGPERCSKAVCSYIAENRERALVLDIGAGTGLLGVQLYAEGFRNIHALDPSRPMLNEAKKKGVYSKFYCEYLKSERNKSLQKDKYDAVVSCAAISPGHLPYDAIIEMIRITKPGGIICLCGRARTLQEEPEYSEFYPLCQQLETAGKWRKEEVTKIKDYVKDADGVIIVYRVL